MQNTAIATTTLPATTAGQASSAWLLNPRWDLIFLIGGVLFVPLPWFVKNSLGLSVTLVNLAVTILIGGPHIFATFTYTIMEKRFWERYPVYAAGVLLIPPAVIYLGLTSFGLLITIFFSWASVHILHQTCFIADCYEKKRRQSAYPLWRRTIDYLLVFTSIYPMAIKKMVVGNFKVAGQNIMLPHVYGNPIIYVAIQSVFLVALALFVLKSLWEWKRGELHGPKLLLVGLTVLVSFFLPTFRDLDLVFQGFNTWHSLQYMGLAWWINNVRKARDEIGSPLVQSISGREKTPFFYLACLIPTFLFLGFIAVLTRFSGLPFNQCYFIVILSGLLAHYYFDHWLFTRTAAVVV